MDLTNLHALLNAQKALWQRIDFASTRIQAAKYPSLLPYRRIGGTAIWRYRQRTPEFRFRTVAPRAEPDGYHETSGPFALPLPICC